MKTLELSTNLIGVDGLFGTYGSYGDSEYTLSEDMIESDFEEGYTDIHPDYYWSHFDNDKYMVAWCGKVHDAVEGELIYLFKGIGIDVEYEALGYYSPKYYNFSTDVCNFNLVAKSFRPLLKYCLEREEEFGKFLKKNYSSYDGFWSHTANNINTWKEDIKADNATAWGASIVFLWNNESDLNDHDSRAMWASESFEGMLYTEFVDYTALEQFQAEMANGTIDPSLFSHDWEKALFERDLVNSNALLNQVNEMYGQGLSVDQVVAVLQENFGEYNFGPMVSRIFTNIGNYSENLFANDNHNDNHITSY